MSATLNILHAVRAMLKGALAVIGILIGGLVLWFVGYIVYDYVPVHHPGDASMIAFFKEHRAEFAELEKLCVGRIVLLPRDNPLCAEKAERLGLPYVSRFEFVPSWPSELEVHGEEHTAFTGSVKYGRFNFAYPLFSYNSVKGYAFIPHPRILLPEEYAARTGRALPREVKAYISFPNTLSGVVVPRLGWGVRNLGDAERAYRELGDGWYLYYVEHHHFR